MPIKDLVKTGIKTAVSFLISILVFVGIAVASALGLFSKYENKFYEPARIGVIQKKLDAVAACSEDYINTILSFISPDEQSKGYLSNNEVLSLLEKEPSDEALRAFELLNANTEAIEGLRVVDKNGKRVHFSSFKGDSRKEGNNRVYSNYGALKTPSNNIELDYNLVSPFVKNGEGETDSEYKLVFDGNEQRIIVSYPVYYQNVGYSFIFYLNLYELTNRLVNEHIISLSDKITLISSQDGKTGGLAFGIPKVGQKLVASEIIKRWENGTNHPEEIVVSKNAVPFSGITVEKEAESESPSEDKDDSASELEVVSWNLITSNKCSYMKVSGLYSLDMLVMPLYVKILLWLAGFITVNLILTMLFSLKKDDDVVIKSRLKKVQMSLLNDYFEKDYSKKKVASLIASQKESLSQKVKASLGHRGKKYGKQLDFILEQSWQDIISLLTGTEGSDNSSLSQDDMQEIRHMFEEIVSSGRIVVQREASIQKTGDKQKSESVANVEKPVNIEPLEELDDVEPLDEVEELGEAEPVEEVEPLEEVEEIEDAQSVEDLEDVEDLDEVEPVEQVESLEKVEDLEEVESIDEVESLEEVEEIEEAEPVEELEEVEEIEEAEPVEELDEVGEIEEAEPVEELAEVELVDEKGHVEEVEALGDVEPVEEVGSLEEVEEIEEAEPVEELEEVEEIEEAEPIEELEEDESEDAKATCAVQKITEEEEKELFKEEVISYGDVRRFEGTEPLKIGTGEDGKENENEDDSVVENFFISAPGDYLFSEEYKTEKTEEVGDLEPVKEEEFMFTTFAANDNNVKELCPEAIVLGDDGVFHITENLNPSAVPVDEEFKRLVDSVLR